MATTSKVAGAAGHRLGSLLVLAQFTLLGALLVLGVPRLTLTEWWLSLAHYLLALGAAFGAAALLANRPGNFSIHPAPRDGATLITGGIYRWVRHPMYTALLVAGLGLSWAAHSWGGRIVWLALLAVLVRKALLEEDWMRATHPDYAAYCERTYRFLPLLY